MVVFLGEGWIEALDEAARADEDLARLTAGLELVVEQTIEGGPDGDVRYHVAIDHGTVRVHSGPAPAATIRFHQDQETAAAIAAGRTAAQRAFMTGRLRVGGDLRVLLDHGEVLGQLGDVFATVRARLDA